ncbi:MAG TPA: Crp/Fnr family transcriptional regulator [Stellaceae bacterium]|nr:Crp/Fnr family transcriptional regulator [Stellaceae bacterium]
MVSPRIHNRLLSALSPEDFALFGDDLRPVPLDQGQVLYAVGDPLKWIYFIEHGLASVMTTMEDGGASEVGMVGPEGMIGASVLLGGTVSAQHIVVQLPGKALRIGARECKAVFDANADVRRVMLRFVEDILNLSAQTAACNRLHLVEQRCARWLLMASDRVQSHVLALTQEFLAAMIGVRRSGVSEAAGELQRSGVIRYRRGEITILDYAALQAIACECYALDRERVERLL